MSTKENMKTNVVTNTQKRPASSQLSFVASEDEWMTTASKTPSFSMRNIQIRSTSDKKRRKRAAPVKSGHSKATPRTSNNAGREKSVSSLTNRNRCSSQKGGKKRGTEIVPGATFLSTRGSDGSSVEDVVIPSTSRKRSKIARPALDSSSSEDDDDDLGKHFLKTKVTNKVGESRKVHTARTLYESGDDDFDMDPPTNNAKNTIARKPISQQNHNSRYPHSSTVEVDADNDSDYSEMIATQDLEVPYAQNLGVSEDKASRVRSFCSDKREEPLRPGDVIQYDHPVFTAGSVNAKRVTQIVSINPRQHFPLELDNGDLLEGDTRIKRIKEYNRGVLYDHPGILRQIDQFRFTKSSLSARERKILPGVREQVSRLMDKVTEEARAALAAMPPSDDGEGYSSDEESSDSDDSSTMTRRPEAAHGRKKTITGQRDQSSFGNKKYSHSKKPTTANHTTSKAPSRKKAPTSGRKQSPTPNKSVRVTRERATSHLSDSDSDDSRSESSQDESKDSATVCNVEVVAEPEALTSGGKLFLSKYRSEKSRSMKLKKKPQQRSTETKSKRKSPSDDSRDVDTGETRRKSSMSSLGGKIESDNDDILFESSSSDYESVASSRLARKEQETIRKKQKKLTGICEEQSASRSKKVSAHHSADQASTSRSSVLRPSSLEGPVRFGEYESSDEEKPGVLRQIFNPSLPERTAYQSDYSSINTFGNSQSPSRKPRNTTTVFTASRRKKQRRQALEDKDDDVIAPTRGGSFQPLLFSSIPSSGTRY